MYRVHCGILRRGGCSICFEVRLEEFDDGIRSLSRGRERLRPHQGRGLQQATKFRLHALTVCACVAKITRAVKVELTGEHAQIQAARRSEVGHHDPRVMPGRAPSGAEGEPCNDPLVLSVRASATGVSMWSSCVDCGAGNRSISRRLRCEQPLGKSTGRWALGGEG